MVLCSKDGTWHSHIFNYAFYPPSIPMNIIILMVSEHMQGINSIVLQSIWTPQLQRKRRRGRKTSDRARTRDLRSIAEFQPREPQRPVEILHPPIALLYRSQADAIQRHLGPAPRGWYCVRCNGSRLSGA